MAETIFLINEDGTLDELKEMAYDSEELLQKLLSDYPKLLAGQQINDEKPRRWLLVSRELGVPDTEHTANRWYLDHLFLDQDAIPTLVEVKRSSDTRIRREVIGQMLDYAANAVVYWKTEELIACYEATCRQRDLDPALEIRNLIGIDEAVDEYWSRVDVNLKAGRIRIILVADLIPIEMKRIIEFLNGQMNPAEIIGIEIKQFVGRNYKTLVPKVIGQTAASQSTKSIRAQIQPNRSQESFFEEMLHFSGSERVEIAQRLLKWLSEKGITLDFGSGTFGWGSCIPYKPQIFGNKKLSVMPFAIWVKGSIEIYFQHYQNRPPFDSIDYKINLMQRLNQIEGINISETSLNKRPSFNISLLARQENYNRFIDTFNWFFDQYNK
jgi:hypothetical protein